MWNINIVKRTSSCYKNIVPLLPRMFLSNLFFPSWTHTLYTWKALALKYASLISPVAITEIFVVKRKLLISLIFGGNLHWRYLANSNVWYLCSIYFKLHKNSSQITFLRPIQRNHRESYIITRPWGEKIGISNTENNVFIYWIFMMIREHIVTIVYLQWGNWLKVLFWMGLW